MKIINLTPRTVKLMPDGPGGPSLTVSPSGKVARCATDWVVETITVDGITIPVNRAQVGVVTDLPEPQPDTIYIVSRWVAEAVDRDDLYYVDDVVQDGQCRVIGAKALSRQ